MTNTSGANLVITDSDALIGLVNKVDALHNRCARIYSYLLENKFTIFTPYPIILEASTALARVVNRSDLAAKLLKDSKEVQNSIDTNVADLVAKLYTPKTSKKNTPFDHFILAVAIKNNIKVVFSFDSFYKKHGLTLVEDLLKN